MSLEDVYKIMTLHGKLMYMYVFNKLLTPSFVSDNH